MSFDGRDRAPAQRISKPIDAVARSRILVALMSGEKTTREIAPGNDDLDYIGPLQEMWRAGEIVWDWKHEAWKLP